MNRRKVGYVLPGHVAAAVVSLYTNGLSGALGNAQGNNGAPVGPFPRPGADRHGLRYTLLTQSMEKINAGQS